MVSALQYGEHIGVASVPLFPLGAAGSGNPSLLLSGGRAELSLYLIVPDSTWFTCLLAA